MKEIKFKAVCKHNGYNGFENGKIYTVDSITPNWTGDKTPMFIELVRINKDGNEKRISLKKEDFILIEYTGLKDKNDKEIYGGDILLQKSVTNSPEYDEICYLKWEKGCYVAIGLNFWRNKSNGNYYKIHEIGVCRLEIIGNINENPELLKKRR